MFGLALVLNDLVVRVNMFLQVHILKFCGMVNMYWQLKGFEVIKGVHLDPIPFDMERDLITPTYKKKRPQLLKFYQVQLSNSQDFISLHIE